MATTKRQRVAPRTGPELVEQGETSSSTHPARGEKIVVSAFLFVLSPEDLLMSPQPQRSRMEMAYVQVPPRTVGLVRPFQRFFVSLLRRPLVP